MLPSSFLYVSSVAALAGTASSLVIFARLRETSRVIGDESVMLAALGILVFGVALALEAVGNALLHPAFPQPFLGKRPAQVTALIVNRGTLLSLPLYMVSYVLMAVSQYVGSVDVRPGRHAAVVLPAILLVYVDINMLSLAVLAAASYMAIVKYGRASLPSAAFYTASGASHLLPFLLNTGYLDWWIVPTSTVLRGLAPVLLLALSTREK